MHCDSLRDNIAAAHDNSFAWQADSGALADAEKKLIARLEKALIFELGNIAG